MKTKILLVFVTVSLLCSFEATTTTDKNILLLEATSQTFCSGIVGGGCGTTYNFRLVARLSSSKLKIDRLWIGKESVDPEIRNLVTREGTNVFRKKDSVLVSATKRTNVIRQYGTENTEGPVHVKYELPYAYSGEALIGYMVNKKRRYLEVKSIRVLPRVNYP